MLIFNLFDKTRESVKCFLRGQRAFHKNWAASNHSFSCCYRIKTTMANFQEEISDLCLNQWMDQFEVNIC